MIPLSDNISYADEKGGTPCVIRVYEGRDGHFKMYLDEGDGYSFEEGNYAFADICYSEGDHSVSVSKTGKFPVNDSLITEFVSK